jgi:outer membrane protein|tara:strand:+ start:36 stop:584 length:549 start_codon:yes stop_codon:yes gene_type:complete
MRRINVQIKRSLTVALALALALMAGTATAETKIAVVDVQRAILNSDEAKRLMAQIQEEFTTEQDEIRKLQTEAAAMLERLQKDAEVITEAERGRVRQQLESKNNDFVYMSQKLQKRVEARQQELFLGIDEKVLKAIEELVLSEDFDMILTRQAAVHVGSLYDVTRKVTEQLNEFDKKADKKK